MLRPVLFGTAGDVWIFWLEAASESQCRYGGQYLLIPNMEMIYTKSDSSEKNTLEKNHLYERAWETFRINRHPKEQQGQGKEQGPKAQIATMEYHKISMNIDEYQKNIIQL